MSNIKLSVIVPTYNHEDYIEECIRSIMSQEMVFEYEVLIGEDCSKDGTRKVLKKLETELPANYKIFYRENNMGMGPSGNAWDLQRRAKGEYIITIEGDDYFLYNQKLKTQVEFLDEHKDFIAVAHNCQVVNEDSENIEEEYPDCKEDEYTFSHYLDCLLAGQLATIMYRREYNEIGLVFYEKYRLYDFYPGDRLKAFLMLSLGRVRCFQEKWSAYRHITSKGTSYSATVRRDKKMEKNELLFYKSIFKFAKDKSDKKAIKTSGKLYFSRYFIRSFEKEYRFVAFVKELFSQKYCMSYMMYTTKRTFMVIVAKIFRKGIEK